jgi:tryptophanyl-tRNA synthetase
MRSTVEQTPKFLKRLLAAGFDPNRPQVVMQSRSLWYALVRVNQRACEQ